MSKVSYYTEEGLKNYAELDKLRELSVLKLQAIAEARDKGD